MCILSNMESNRYGAAWTEDAGQQLAQLRADQRWARLVGHVPSGYDLVLGGAVVAHLLMIAGAVARVGPYPGYWFGMGVIDLAMPIYQLGVLLKSESGSWLGSTDKRPSPGETLVVGAAYVIGLISVIMAARHEAWATVVLSSVAAGLVWTVVSRRWMIRYREEYGYRVTARLYVKFPLYLAFLVASNVAVIYAMALLARLEKFFS
jgi:hypothetical protein